jgi:hypothetical protein
LTAWTWTPIESTKNMQRFKGGVRVDAHWKGTVRKVTEWVLVKKANAGGEGRGTPRTSPPLGSLVKS